MLRAMLDIALQYDAAARRFDVALAGRDLVLDRTPATAMLLSIGCDRRARADDALPNAPAPQGFGDRRGWVGDALDGQARRLGSRLWLLHRAKQSDLTRRRAEAHALEALSGLSQRGLSVTAEAEWLRAGVLQLTARAGSTTVAVNLQATS